MGEVDEVTARIEHGTEGSSGLLMFGRSRIETKTPEQIARMRRAGLVVGQTLQLIAQTVRPGMTTKALDELAEEHIRGSGAKPSFLGYHGFSGSLCTSVNDEVVHGIPGSRVLHEGDLLSIDCGAIVDGWHGDAAISVIVGGRDAGRAEDLALIDATEDSMWAGIAALAVGQPLYAVGAAVEDSVTAAGERAGREYGIVEDYVGHGIGTAMHQDPQVPNYRVRDRGPHRALGRDRGHRADGHPRRPRRPGCSATSGPWSPPTARGRRTGRTPWRSPTRGSGC